MRVLLKLPSPTFAVPPAVKAGASYGPWATPSSALLHEV